MASNAVDQQTTAAPIKKQVNEMTSPFDKWLFRNRQLFCSLYVSYQNDIFASPYCLTYLNKLRQTAFSNAVVPLNYWHGKSVHGSVFQFIIRYCRHISLQIVKLAIHYCGCPSTGECLLVSFPDETLPLHYRPQAINSYLGCNVARFAVQRGGASVC